MPLRGGRRTAVRPAPSLLGALAVLTAVLLLAGCTSTPARSAIGTGTGPTGALEPSPATSSDSGPATSGSGSAATAGLTTSTGVASRSAQPCTATIGSVLRERTTVTSAGAVTVLAGALPCRGVGVWLSSFTLNEDPAADPTPRYVGGYTGAAALSARLPSVGGSCTASAVFFSLAAQDKDDTSAAGNTAAQARSDLAYWPSGQSAIVPAGAILQGRTSVLLAASVSGDPARCSLGEDVATPVAAVKDCWISVPGTSGSSFRKTSCNAQHTHEVYWAESLLPQQYAAQALAQGISPSAWAHKRADDVCVAKRDTIALTHDVRQSDIALEFLWPSGLAYPPTGAGWAHSQVVCLARWKDGKPSDRHLLHR
jgi:hypothetical protein